MAKSKRQISSDRVVDTGLLDNLGFNSSSGAFKKVLVGPVLEPLSADGSTFTTDATAGINLGIPGQTLAIYNNSGSVGSVVASLTSAAILAAGVTDVDGNVGIACPPNAWTYVSMGDAIFIISSASTLLVYQIQDDTYLSKATYP